MTTKQDVVDHILADVTETPCDKAAAFAPANIALCKYWGKRDTELNLPITSSLSLSLGTLGSRCRLSFAHTADEIILNGKPLAADTPFAQRASHYLNLFRKITGRYYRIDTTNTIPTAAGFASSASGFAALVLALNQLHGWNLPQQKCSILARLGSGSACRSLWQGFVEWHAGHDPAGNDSIAEPLEDAWPELRLGLLVVDAGRKPLSSRDAMQRTVETSSLYKAWPEKVATDIHLLKKAIAAHDFQLLGTVAESNALTMHATMIAANPPILYWQSDSIRTIHQVQQCRAEGIPVYITMDAGPNPKLLFQTQDIPRLQRHFPSLQIADAYP